AQVEQHDVGPGLAGHGHRLLGGAGAAGDHDVGRGVDEERHPLADHRVVVDHQQADPGLGEAGGTALRRQHGIQARIVHPPSSLVETLSCPPTRASRSAVASRPRPDDGPAAPSAGPGARPTPSSATTRLTPPSTAWRLTTTDRARACFSALWRASRAAWSSTLARPSSRAGSSPSTTQPAFIPVRSSRARHSARNATPSATSWGTSLSDRSADRSWAEALATCCSMNLRRARS